MPSARPPCPPKHPFSRGSSAAAKAKDVPLSVIAETTTAGTRVLPPRPHSRMGLWRALVLIVIHLVIVAHIVQWLYSGMSDGVRHTLSPVEPSESMATLETGRINAGFVMFVAAILSTAIFGRFFCGWACHVVALQDLCGWMMKKVGIHPKPWRSRLLLWFPLGLALYLFVWPTFRREVLVKLWLWNDLNADGIIQFGEYPTAFGDIIPLHGFTAGFMVEDFWATFPPWYVAIPFLLVCGFVTVYFMGAKAFCTYGCPYGGFFTPADRLAPLRIRVDDSCNHCGHCTAVCTSNVRVHEEVRDFGAVVDPGCMKCLDCVSACPNDALRLGFGTPAAFAKPRVSDAQALAAKQARARRWDLSLSEELFIAGVALVLVVSVRGLYGWIPLLMAMGVASIGAFAVFTCWRLVRDANVRAPFWQLKRDRRLRPAGYVFVLGTLAYLAFAGHGLVINYALWHGELVESRLRLTREQVLSPTYKPAPADLKTAQSAINLFKLTRQIGAGGVAIKDQLQPSLRLSWLHAVAGNLPASQAALVRAINIAQPQGQGGAELIGQLVRVMQLQRASSEAQLSQLEALQARWPVSDAIRQQRAFVLLQTQKLAEAQDLYTQALREHANDVSTVRSAANLRLHVQDLPGSIAALRTGLAVYPRNPDLNEDLGTTLLISGKPDDALKYLTEAAEHTPTVERYRRLAQLLTEMRRAEPARAATRRADELDAKDTERQLARAPSAELFARLAVLQRALGEGRAAERTDQRARDWQAKLNAKAKASTPRPPAPG